MKNKFLYSIILIISSIFILSSCGKKEDNTLDYKYYIFGDEYQSKTYYYDDYFKEESTKYNPHLSTTSMHVVCATTPDFDKDDMKARGHNIVDLASKMGFLDITLNDGYCNYVDKENIGAVFGHKAYKDYNLLLVSVRGLNYKAEWYSNMILGSDYKTNAEGFTNGSNLLLNDIKDYIELYRLQGKMKIWLTGFSRGGAVAYLTAAKLDLDIKNNIETFTNVKLTLDDIYTYTFESPSGATIHSDISPKNKLFNNIFNVYNTNDLVTHIAPYQFDFTRYGIDHVFSSLMTDINYFSRIDDIKRTYNLEPYALRHDEYPMDKFKFYVFDEDFSAFNYMINLNKLDTNRINYTTGIFMKELIDNIVNSGISSRDVYQDSYQEVLAVICETIMGLKFNLQSKLSGYLKSLVNKIDTIINALKTDFESGFDEFLLPIIEDVLDILEIKIEGNLRTQFDNLSQVSKKVFINDNTLLTTLINKNNISILANGHFPDLTIANLKLEDSYYTSDVKEYRTNGDYYYLSIPLDEIDNISIYEVNTNKLVAGIIDDKLVKGGIVPYSIINNSFNCYLPYSNYKIICNEKENISLKYFDYKMNDISISCIKEEGNNVFKIN